MRHSEALELHRIGIRRLVASHFATNHRVFGLILRGTDTEASDIDILVDVCVCQSTMNDLFRMRLAVEELTGKRTDIVTANGFHAADLVRVLGEAIPI